MLRLDQVQDLATLRAAALLLEQENRKLIDKVVALQRELLAAQGHAPADLQLRLAQLEQQLAQRNQALFGRSSEQRSHAPDAPPDAAADATPDAPPATDAAPGRRKDGKAHRKGHGPRAQPQLRGVTQPHALDAADCACPQCGGTLAVWDGQTEDSEEIGVITREFVITTHQRQKYRCRCGHVETALGPDKLVPGGRYSVDFAIEVAVEKYVYHLPLTRQVGAMASQGLVVDAQTLFDQLAAVCRVLRPAWQALRAYVLTSAVVLADETRWPLWSQDGVPRAAPARWHIWGAMRSDAVYYQVFDTRGSPAAETLFAGYRGTLLTDDYAVYGRLETLFPGIRCAGCWVHARRGFVEIAAFFPRECGAILDLIGELYTLERGIPPGPAGDDDRRRVRDTASRAVVKRIQAWCLATPVIPGSGLDAAIKSLAGRWTSLLRFLDDPRIPLDTNAIERGLRGPVVGRKNHYGSRSLRGLEVAAILYSLVESAKLNGVDPRAYLRHAVRAGLRGDRVPLPHEVRDVLKPNDRPARGDVAEAPAQ